MVIKVKKNKKKRMGRHGHGASWRGSGRRGGVGMAGTGKRADHKKSLVISKYGNKYFGKQGITSKGTAKRKLKTINLREIANKFLGKTEANLKDYKILGDGELTKAITITVNAFTKTAKEKVEKAGGKIIVLEKKVRPETVVKAKEEKKEKDSDDKKEEKNK